MQSIYLKADILEGTASRAEIQVARLCRIIERCRFQARAGF